MRKVATLVMLVLVGCGRIGFDVGDAVDGSRSDGTSGDGGLAVSCAGLAPTCGLAGTSSCCGSLQVAGGTFDRGYDVGGDGMYPDMSFPATMGDFRLDTYEVTVGRFRQFVAAGQGTQASPPIPGAGGHPSIANSGWEATWNGSLVINTASLVTALNCDATYQTWTDTPGTNESLPMNCITWFEAMSFCAWDGGFVPTEAEWNYAASGGSEQRAYPWSSPPAALGIDCSYANYDPGSYCVNPPTGGFNRVGSESPKGDGKWGQSDLAGNGWEWTLDWYATPYTNPCINCANLTAATSRVVRGGVFGSPATDVRAGSRYFIAPTFRDYLFVARCARTL